MASADGAAPTGDNQAPPGGPRGEGHRGRGRGRGGRGGRGRGDHSRGRGRGGGRGGGGPVHQQGGNAVTSDPTSQEPKKAPNFKSKAEAPDAEGDDNAETCFICANPITHFSVAPCNHTTCHICSLRLRALYKSKDCPHCRTSSPYVIFTDDGTKRFEEYTNKDITSTDDNIGIKYAGEEIVGDTILLLRFNCPDSECDFAGLGWQDLHQHVRHVHHMKMCDLCTRNKKVFTHEHELFADKQLTEHMRHGDDKPGAADQTGFRGHPLCGFCGARFYDSDKLYEHCRNKHERCFLCDRRDSRQPHYFLDYDSLEQHFKKDHFLCNDRECLEKKFVVFESEMDLKAHQLSEHGGSVGTGRDARRVDMSNFDLRQRYEQERGAPRGGRNQERRRAPDPANEPIPVSSAQPLRRDEIAFQRQMAIQSGASTRAPPAPAPAPGPSRPPPAAASRPPAASQTIDAMQHLSITDWSSLTQEQRASLARHNAVVERASNLLGNNENKIATFRQYISNYNRGSMNPTQLIDAFASLFADTSSDTALGILVREVAELFEDKKKGDSLRAAWQNRRARVQERDEEYPSLPGLGGMHGATTSTTGWATAAAPTTISLHNNGAAQQQRNSNRVLKLKNSTRRGSISNSSVMSFASASSGNAAGPSRGITTASPTAFPALPSASRPAAAAAAAATRSQPSWIGGGTSAPAAPAPRSTTTASHVGTGARRPPPPLQNSSDAFPALPAAPKPKTTIFGYGRGVVRRDFGVKSDTGFSWGGGGGGGGGGSGSNAGGSAGGGGGENAEQQQHQHQHQQEQGGGGGGGKGGKKNKKQVLAHWG